MPRRVLHVLATAHQRGAGICRMVEGLSRTLDPKRYRLHAWFLGGDGPLAAGLSSAGVPVRTFEWDANRNDWAGAWRFWRSLRQEAFPIVHLHFGGRALPFVIRCAHPTKIVLHLHGGEAEAGNPGLVVVRSWAADTVVVVSKAVARIVAGAQPRVVYHSIEVPEDTRAAAPTHGRPGPVLGTAGRLVPIKGIVYLLRAFAVLYREFPQVHLEVAGAGPEQEALHQEANAVGISDRVTFLGWQADMWPVLARWDIFVQPSLDEGFGMAALEAMAAGLPVVGTAVGGLPELIGDGRTGYIVPPADETALAERLRDLLRNAERRRSMGRAGRARVLEYFTTDRMTAELTRMYDELLG